jgi:hypothetical protein
MTGLSPELEAAHQRCMETLREAYGSFNRMNELVATAWEQLPLPTSMEEKR